jgi:hypothetical protein
VGLTATGDVVCSPCLCISCVDRDIAKDRSAFTRSRTNQNVKLGKWETVGRTLQQRGRVVSNPNIVKQFSLFLISSFHRVLNVAYNLLGCSPACGV